ncbi:hypothetical protein GCM10011344_47630 [Dokdonia pacifica]|uniref:Immunity MXAN-0049 protein domain-containing protein n=1 Tax=Dokdonia pacifica TaxID=1627892 RepID=A0A239DUE3_9FLAO|nr:DUF1629 domain-containing protein [Dokdonia pacifica]GGG41210.1 hypothetical protein GCM10011344_47630 [Dokdonia pacifica]SNS36100.1 hypothetical protein SAMN06265376_11268 [Dokdonia pacifica]
MSIYRIKSYSGDNFCYVDSNTGLDIDFIDDLTEGNLMFFDDNRIPSINLKRKTKILPDILGTGSAEFFVNDKVKEILELNITEQKINFSPIRIDKYNYWLLNIIGLLDCFDNEKSGYTTFENGNIDDVHNLKFKKEKIPEISIFRIKENTVRLFITEKLKNIFEEAGVTGVKYSDNMDLTMGI